MIDSAEHPSLWRLEEQVEEVLHAFLLDTTRYAVTWRAVVDESPPVIAEIVTLAESGGREGLHGLVMRLSDGCALRIGIQARRSPAHGAEVDSPTSSPRRDAR